MGYDTNSFPYLDGEDRLFCVAFRLTEDAFLKLCGGLKAYTQHRLNRSQARGATMTSLNGERMTFDVSRLPGSVEEAMDMIKLPGLKEDEFASYLLEEQITKARGIVDTLRANRVFADQEERRTEDLKNQREGALARLRREAASIYGWGEDSQSAKDWAEQKYVERKGRV